mmetsp:Transcript_9048/g.27120  ORF Transcript_9048/g.27120 Transcript_9048/m.27120 type:complete len:216 (+) Transcript_9048:4848-5495(+)
MESYGRLLCLDMEASGGEVFAPEVLSASGEADGRPQDVVGDGEGRHQRKRHSPHLQAEVLDQAGDGLGLLGGDVVVVAEQGLLVDALQRKKVRQCLEGAAAVGVHGGGDAAVEGIQHEGLLVRLRQCQQMVQTLVPRVEGTEALGVLAEAQCHRVQQPRHPVPEGPLEEGGVTQVAGRRVVGHQGVWRQGTNCPLLEVRPRSTHRPSRKLVLVSL